MPLSPASTKTKFMAIVAKSGRAGRRASALNWHLLRQRLMPLLLLAFFCEVTLPYQADCPLYHPGHVFSKTASADTSVMDADCPSAIFHQASTGVKDIGKDKKPATRSCSLCDLTNSFVGAVAAGLIALPPPPLFTDAFTYVDIYEPKLPTQQGFSARAPPIAA